MRYSGPSDQPDLTAWHSFLSGIDCPLTEGLNTLGL